MKQKTPINAAFWRLGSEVWAETEHGMLMIPPNMLAKIPAVDRLPVDPELAAWVAELRGGAAGPRVAAVVDEETETATIGGIPANYTGVRMVASVWEGYPVHWHVRGETARALWKGKAIAEVRFDPGRAAEPAMVLDVDGRLWIATYAMCMLAEDVRAQVTKQPDKILRKGEVIEKARVYLTAPLGPQYEPRPDPEDHAVWVGPARLQARYHGVIASRFPGCTWHATGQTDPVTAARDGKRVAIVMPAPLWTKGGAA